jgi:hypothetical protein
MNRRRTITSIIMEALKNEELYFKSQGYEKTRVGTINARLDTCIYIYYYLLYQRYPVLGFLKVIKELGIYSLIVLLNQLN